MDTTNKMALSATLHCLTGCAVGEIAGLSLGLIFGWPGLLTLAVAVSLAFIIGYILSMIPLLKAGVPLKKALVTVLAADTLSILTMEIVDNAVLFVIPGAMSAGLVNPWFWATLAFALFVAFWAAFPVNRYLLSRGKGHALVHHYHHGGVE